MLRHDVCSGYGCCRAVFQNPESPSYGDSSQRVFAWGCYISDSPEQSVPDTQYCVWLGSADCGIHHPSASCDSMRHSSSKAPSRKGNILVLSAFRDPSYILTIVSLFFLIWGMFTPFFYIETYATYRGMPPRLASYMLSILNAASIIGRIIPGILADHFGNFTLLFISGACTGVLLLCWMAIKSNAAIIVFAALYGFFSGAIVSLLSPCIAQIAPHPTLIGAYLGMALLLVGVSGLTGTPICGALIDGYGWWAAMVFSGVAVFVGSGLVLVTQFTLMRKRKG